MEEVTFELGIEGQARFKQVAFWIVKAFQPNAIHSKNKAVETCGRLDLCTAVMIYFIVQIVWGGIYSLSLSDFGLCLVTFLGQWNVGGSSFMILVSPGLKRGWISFCQPFWSFFPPP